MIIDTVWLLLPVQIITLSSKLYRVTLIAWDYNRQMYIQIINQFRINRNYSLVTYMWMSCNAAAMIIRKLLTIMIYNKKSLLLLKTNQT